MLEHLYLIVKLASMKFVLLQLVEVSEPLGLSPHHFKSEMVKHLKLFCAIVVACSDINCGKYLLFKISKSISFLVKVYSKYCTV